MSGQNACLSPRTIDRGLSQLRCVEVFYPKGLGSSIPVTRKLDGNVECGKGERGRMLPLRSETGGKWESVPG